MRKVLVFCLFAAMTCGLNAQTTPQLKNSADSASYALGQLVGLNLKQETMNGLNVDVLLKAMESALKDQPSLIDPQQAESIFMAYSESLAKAKNEKNRVASQKFLDDNKKRAGVTTTVSGLQYEVLKKGTGTVSPKASDNVKVHYHGTLADGSDPDQQSAFFVRQSVNLIVTADEITCQNLHLWLEGEIVNLVGSQMIQLEHVIARTHFRAVATRDLCNGSFLSIVLHRVAIVTTSDLLFQSAAITGNQFTLRALRDAGYPENPYGYIEISPGDCELS